MTNSAASAVPTGFSQARQAMVDSQINPAGVTTEAVLQAYRTTPRELFVPAQQQGVCYTDNELPVGDTGRSLMEPMVHARLVEAAEIKPDDRVLDVGGLTGYSAAILARLCKSVVALEQEEWALRTAQQAWSTLALGNLIGILGPMADGCLKHGPYNVIIINGAMTAIPQALIDQLAPDGRLLGVLQPDNSPAGTAILATKLAGEGKANFSTRSLFNAAAPYLTGFGPKPRFVF